jgi:hypothetical protein
MVGSHRKPKSAVTSQRHQLHRETIAVRTERQTLSHLTDRTRHGRWPGPAGAGPRCTSCAWAEAVRSCGGRSSSTAGPTSTRPLPCPSLKLGRPGRRCCLEVPVRRAGWCGIWRDAHRPPARRQPGDSWPILPPPRTAAPCRGPIKRPAPLAVTVHPLTDTVHPTQPPQTESASGRHGPHGCQGRGKHGQRDGQHQRREPRGSGSSDGPASGLPAPPCRLFPRLGALDVEPPEDVDGSRVRRLRNLVAAGPDSTGRRGSTHGGAYPPTRKRGRP